MTKIVNAWNEWDPLKRLILGRPEGTQIAAPEPGHYSHQPENGFPLGAWGMFPKHMVYEANEQMDGFVDILESRGIVVDRVEVHPAYSEGKPISTPDWGLPNVRGTNCPRVLFMTIGHEIIEGPGAQRARWFEYLNLRPVLERYSLPSSTRPKPPLVTSPQPTPPPLCKEIQLAPLNASPMTFWTAISAVNFEPSYILDVSLKGESVPATS